MNVWVGRGRGWQLQQQLVPPVVQEDELQLQNMQQQENPHPVTQVLPIITDGKRGAEPLQEGSVQVAQGLPDGHHSGSTRGTDVHVSSEAEAKAGAAQGIGAAAGEPEAGEELVDPSSVWPFRYEKPGMEWRESGVAFRGAQWRAAVGGWMNAHAHALPVVETTQVREESERGGPGGEAVLQWWRNASLGKQTLASVCLRHL